MCSGPGLGREDRNKIVKNEKCKLNNQMPLHEKLDISDLTIPPTDNSRNPDILPVPERDIKSVQ